VSCEAVGASTSEALYKCVKCPVAVEGSCDAGTSFGAACGDGGSCTKSPGYCSGEFSCFGGDEPTETAPDGGFAKAAGSAGSPGSSSSDSGGCSIGSPRTDRSLAVLMIAIGSAAIAISRQRKRDA
jgi:hypothetical protein